MDCGYTFLFEVTTDALLYVDFITCFLLTYTSEATEFTFLVNHFCLMLITSTFLSNHCLWFQNEKNHLLVFICFLSLMQYFYFLLDLFFSQTLKLALQLPVTMIIACIGTLRNTIFVFDL